MKVWVTKYSLTRGVYESEDGKLNDDGSFTINNWCGSYYQSKDFSLTKEEAIKVAEKMRDDKLKSLERQEEKLKNMKF